MWKNRLRGIVVSVALLTGVTVGFGAPSAAACTTVTTVPSRSACYTPSWHCVRTTKAHWWSRPVCVSWRWY